MGKKYDFKTSKYRFRGKRQRTDEIGRAISCTGKIKWWSKQVASEHAEDVNSKLIGDRKLRAYKCAFSPATNLHWHVGREPRKLNI